MNYLIMEDFAGHPAVFIFPERVDHADMRSQLPYVRVLSCGCVNLSDAGFHCEGGNAELGAQTGPEDGAIIANVFTKAN